MVVYHYQHRVIGDENESQNIHVAVDVPPPRLETCQVPTPSRSESELESLPCSKPCDPCPVVPQEEELFSVSTSCAVGFRFPNKEPVRPSSNTPTITRFPPYLKAVPGMINSTTPTAVAIGLYHYDDDSVLHRGMLGAKEAAVEEFCRLAAQPREAVQGEIRSVADDAWRCYDWGAAGLSLPDQNNFEDIMLWDGCFLLQFMVSMCPDDDDDDNKASPESDPLISRHEVHTRVDAISRDILLLENQIPWIVLEALITKFLPSSADPVGRFLALMASAFDIGNNYDKSTTSQYLGRQPNGRYEPPPPHLFALFHRCLVGAMQTQSLREPILPSLSTTAMELTEMGVKLTASKTKKFGDMAMSKRRHCFGLFGELSLAPVVLNELTMCWLVNMAAHEACLGATQADNFAVSSYIFLLALLVNRPEDVQEMRAKGILVSTLCDKGTLRFFKVAAPHLRVGHRYFDVFKRLLEYKQERWMWIAFHRFLYRNVKTIVAVLSVVGVLAGLFKTILSLKQPQR